jgi:hypothetical protein
LFLIDLRSKLHPSPVLTPPSEICCFLTAIGFENYEIRHETFALAKVIYFILTGRTSNYHREKNEALNKFISRAISADKGTRYLSVEEMKEYLYSKVYPTLHIRG